VILIGLFQLSAYFVLQRLVLGGDPHTVAEQAVELIKDGTRIIVIDNDNEAHNSLLNEVYCDPELFYIKEDYNVFYSNLKFIAPFDKAIYFFEHKYHDVDDKQSQIDAIVSSALDTLNIEHLSDYEKTVSIYDWIINNIEYQSLPNNGEQDLYGAIVQKKAVCSGYSKAFAYMLNKSGIDAYVVAGEGKTRNGTWGPHGWAIAYIDDKPYYFDITWDAENGKPYDWFAVTSKEFDLSHIPNTQMGKVNAVCTDENYYIKNELYLAEQDTQLLIDIVCKQGKEWHIKCADAEVLEFVLQSLENQGFCWQVANALGVESIRVHDYIVTSDVLCLHVKFI
jgi:hypothetical protein